MTPDELKGWRKMMALTQFHAADVLGLSRRKYQRMEHGLDPIRLCVDLACAAYAMGIRCYDGSKIVALVTQQRKKES